MQPYLFPYLGYFQLIHAVDEFILYDDVSFIRNGWINRNRLLGEGKPEYFTIPLLAASSFQKINAARFQAADARWRRKLLARVEQQYARASFVESGLTLLREVLDIDSDLVADLAIRSVELIMRTCAMTTGIVRSSALTQTEGLTGEARIIDICVKRGAAEYVNAPGGRALYERAHFEQRGIRLGFLVPDLSTYGQARATEFVPGLSILDVLMNCGPVETAKRIAKYEVEFA